MLLAWKNAHRFEASTFLLMASVCAPLPSVSDNARNKAITAISNAIFLFEPEACSAFSACSMLSFAPMIPSCQLPKRFRAKWMPVRVKKTRQKIELEAGPDSISTEPASSPTIAEQYGERKGLAREVHGVTAVCRKCAQAISGAGMR